MKCFVCRPWLHVTCFTSLNISIDSCAHVITFNVLIYFLIYCCCYAAYDVHSSEDMSLPRLICVITGQMCDKFFVYQFWYIRIVFNFIATCYNMMIYKNMARHFSRELSNSTFAYSSSVCALWNTPAGENCEKEV